MFQEIGNNIKNDILLIILGLVWNKHYSILGDITQSGYRLTRIFDDTDSDLWSFLRTYGFFKQALNAKTVIYLFEMYYHFIF